MSGLRARPTISALLLLMACLAGGASSGCSTRRLHLTAVQKEIVREMATNAPSDDPRPRTAVIDIHTHTFNARYLPLRGILLGKRDAKPPYTWLISDAAAGIIADAVTGHTALSSVPGHAGQDRSVGTLEMRRTRAPGWLAGVLLGLIDKAEKKEVWDRSRPFQDRMRSIDQVASNMTTIEKIAVRSAAEMMGMGDHVRDGTSAKGKISGVAAAVRFIWTLTLADGDLPRLYREMHAGPATQGPITMVSHMMDLGPVYDQCADGTTLLDLPTQQVPRMEHFQAQPGSDLLYFVAYNPYRDHPGRCPSPGALDVVRDAITAHGAKGVKVYPPSGYRPAGNDVVDRPHPLGTRYPGRQWDARYLGFGPEKCAQGAGLDASLEQLLLWCMTNDIPVFAHSGHGEFEARKGYGVHHSDPGFWGRFLAAHSSPGKPCPLRLCLGHAGGEDYWFGNGEHEDWGLRAYELCTRYPNVYCEVTTSDALLDPARQAFFIDRLVTKFAESDAAALASTCDKPRFRFATKLMYGTDWPLPDQGEPAAVFAATQKTFLHPRLVRHFGDYFSGNARRYLRLDTDPGR
jgi:predicted TIM-barrel fold metal-dependent hydrolase